MNIGEPIKELGDIDYMPLRDKILSLDANTWDENVSRQEMFDVHKKTSSLVLVFCDGWPEMTVSKEVAWDYLADSAVPLMDQIINKHYEPGGMIIRAMAAKLLPGENIASHWDSHPSFRCGHRIHLPIKTNSRVRFNIDGFPYQFDVGEAYELNNQKTHSVINKGAEERIHFIFDYVPLSEVEKLPAILEQN